MKGTHPNCLEYKPCPACSACNCRLSEELCVCHNCLAYLLQKDGRFSLVDAETFLTYPLEVQEYWKTLRLMTKIGNAIFKPPKPQERYDG